MERELEASKMVVDKSVKFINEDVSMKSKTKREMIEQIKAVM